MKKVSNPFSNTQTLNSDMKAVKLAGNYMIINCRLAGLELKEDMQTYNSYPVSCLKTQQQDI